MSYPAAGLGAGAVLAMLAAALAAHFLAKAGFPLPSDGKRIGRIDGLRGFLALSVMVHHFAVWTQATRPGGEWAAPTINLFAQLGPGAVALFFMTTGLLFYPRILAGFRSSSWGALYISRIFRIIPLSAFAFAIVALIVVFQTGTGFDPNFPAAALQWITAAGEPPLLGYEDAGKINAYVLWSLKYEWQFYLVALPLCALAMEAWRKSLPSWLLPVTIILVAAFAKKMLPGVGLLKYMPLFATGMLAFEAQSRPAIARRLRSRPAAALAFAALAAALIWFRSPFDLAWPLFALFFFAVACGNDLGGVLKSKAAVVLGECSYGIYLMHGIVLYVLFMDGRALTGLFAAPYRPLLLPLAAVAAVLLTAATFLAVERPGMSAGRLLAGRWRVLSAGRVSLAPE